MSDTNESPRIQGDTGAVEFNVHPTIEDDAIESLMHLIDKGALITPSEGLRVKMCVWLGVSRGLDLAFLNAD